MAFLGEILVQKLYKDEHFDEILLHNKQNIGDWKNFYPNHLAWINRVIDDFKNKSNSRIAFGGFYHDIEKRKWRLCCSVIVKKNPFSPYLEIKNLITFSDKDLFKNIEFQRECQRQLLKHIIKFAEQRGYPKLVTELFNRNKKDKDLIKIFIDNDFIIAGSHIDKYHESDESIFLTTEVNQIYGFDPYDNLAATKWILSQYLKSDEPEKVDKEVKIIDENGNSHDGISFKFYSGKRFDPDQIASKFNIQNNVVVIEEYFKSSRDIKEIKSIVNNTKSANLFVFDFSEQAKSLIKSLDNKDYLTIFDRTELENLLGYDKRNNKLRRFSHNEIGGLLLISNPIILKNCARAPKDILKDGKYPIYIKLGYFGTFITEDMPLVFAYYPENSDRSKLEIWGYAKLSQIPSLYETKDSELLYEAVEDDLTDDKTDELIAEILWSKAEFEMHNAYNATNKIVAFSISEIHLLKSEKNEFIDIQHILSDKDYIKDIETVFDFYLSKEEVTNIETKLKSLPKRATFNRNKSIVKSSIPSSLIDPYKMLFVAAMPSDKTRISFNEEFTVMQNLLKGKDFIHLLQPLLSADYISLIKEVQETAPHILHLAMHGDLDTLYLTNKQSRKSQPTNLNDFRDVLKGHKELKLLILNACNSEKFANEISKNYFYTIGINGKIDTSEAVKLSEYFYNGFVVKTNEPKLVARIKLGIKNVLKNSTILSEQISLWKDGNKVVF